MASDWVLSESDLVISSSTLYLESILNLEFLVFRLPGFSKKETLP